MPQVAALVRLALRYGPYAKTAIEQARKQVEPPVRAYLLAQQIDGYIVDWPASDGHYHFVLDRDQRRVVDSFPRPAPRLHAEVLAGDVGKRVHHRDHWVNRVKQRALRTGELPRRAIRRARPPYREQRPLWDD